MVDFGGNYNNVYSNNSPGILALYCLQMLFLIHMTEPEVSNFMSLKEKKFVNQSMKK